MLPPPSQEVCQAHLSPLTCSPGQILTWRNSRMSRSPTRCVANADIPSGGTIPGTNQSLSATFAPHPRLRRRLEPCGSLPLERCRRQPRAPGPEPQGSRPVELRSIRRPFAQRRTTSRRPRFGLAKGQLRSLFSSAAPMEPSTWEGSQAVRSPTCPKSAFFRDAFSWIASRPTAIGRMLSWRRPLPWRSE